MTIPFRMPDWKEADPASPGLLERRGVHVMRERAVRWCRQHPDAARALPSWSPDVLARVLELSPPVDSHAHC